MKLLRRLCSLALPACVLATSHLARQVVLPVLQDIALTITTSLLPAPIVYLWTWEAQRANSVPFAAFISGPEGFGLLAAPLTLPGDWGQTVTGTDQVTGTISIDSNSLGFHGVIDEYTRLLSSCAVDVGNATVVVADSALQRSETVTAEVQCSTPYQA